MALLLQLLWDSRPFILSDPETEAGLEAAVSICRGLNGTNISSIITGTNFLGAIVRHDSKRIYLKSIKQEKVS